MRIVAIEVMPINKASELPQLNCEMVTDILKATNLGIVFGNAKISLLRNEQYQSLSPEQFKSGIETAKKQVAWLNEARNKYEKDFGMACQSFYTSD